MHGAKTALVTVIVTLTAAEYCNRIVAPHIAPFIRRHNAKEKVQVATALKLISMTTHDRDGKT